MCSILARAKRSTLTCREGTEVLSFGSSVANFSLTIGRSQASAKGLAVDGWELN